jgi:putative FmdB family regulatory protein
MPLYEYRCENGHTFEVMQRMSDEPVTTCPECGATVQRVFHPVAVHFKGSGFYNTDYGKKKKGAAVSDDSGGSSDSKKESTAKPAKSESSTGSSSSTPSKSD